MVKVDCQEHSKSMELLALRIRIEKGISDPKELETVKKKIELLEKDLNLD
jgi:hypothetical protein